MTSRDSVDMTASIAPRSDQLNAEDMLTGPRTFTVDKVTRGSVEQPVEIHLVEFPGRPFKPSKTVRRLLVAAWGAEAANYTGRRMTLFRDPAVRFGGQDVGGIRISHLSHIDKPMKLALTETRGKRKMHTVDPLPDTPPPSRAPNPDKIVDAFKSLGVTVEQLELRVGADREKWTEEDLDKLVSLGQSIKAGETTVIEEFGDPTPDDAA